MKRNTSILIMAMETIVITIALFFTSYAAFAEPTTEPPARLLVLDPQVLTQEQEDRALFLKAIQEGCEQKGRVAVIVFAAREEGRTEKDILDTIENTVRTAKEQGATIRPSDEVDFSRMVRDIYRTSPNGDYKIPLSYAESFGTNQYESCLYSFNPTCTLIASKMTEAEGTVHCQAFKY